MSRTIDERIVEMRFDNAQFEKNVATSMSTLDKLKKSLKFNSFCNIICNIIEIQSNLFHCISIS